MTQKIIEYQGQLTTIAEAVRLAGNIVNDDTARKRLRKGWAVELAVTTPIREKLPPGEAERRRADRDRIRKRKRRTDKRQVPSVKIADPKGSKTSPTFRFMKFGRAPYKTKQELRAELTQAVLNTQAMTVQG